MRIGFQGLLAVTLCGVQHMHIVRVRRDAMCANMMQAVGPVAVTSLLLGSGIPNIIDVPIQDNPNNPRNQHAQDVYNHTAIQVMHKPHQKIKQIL